MSHALVRRNSSKQGLQNLLRLTAQRSIEDAEEVERERRRRVRDEMKRRDSGSLQGESPESDTPTEDSQLDGSFKPSGSPSLEEDEGFSDWTQRRERQRLLRRQEQSPPGAEEEYDEEYNPNPGQKNQGSSQPSITASRLQKEEQERLEMERRKQRQEEAVRAERARRERDRDEQAERVRREEEERRKSHKPNTEPEKRKEVKVSYTSRVVLQQEPKHVNTNGNASPQEMVAHSTSASSWTKRSTSRSAEPEESEAILETEQRLEKIRRGLQEKESQELEQLRQRQGEAEQELEELKRRREERRHVREEEERRREEEEQHRQAKEEEEKRRMKEEIERRRMEAAERMKSLSTSSVDSDETFSPFSPKTPTHKITERTESLNRSLKKSNSFKKTAPLILTSKIDDKLEQYTHAIENSHEVRSVKAAPSDLPSTPEVASKKNLFEAGEAWSQSPTKAPGSKQDTDGLKVGVADLITQWVKAPNDSSRQIPGKPSDVKPGDVMQKRNMWEGIGEMPRSGPRARGSTSSKKYKFVVTGHGKYEKISVDEEDGEFSNDL